MTLPLFPVDGEPDHNQGDRMSGLHMTAERFRELREQLEMTQEEIAAWGDVNPRTIQRFEAGTQPVPKIWKLALDGLIRNRGKASR